MPASLRSRIQQLRELSRRLCTTADEVDDHELRAKLLKAAAELTEAAATLQQAEPAIS